MTNTNDEHGVIGDVNSCASCTRLIKFEFVVASDVLQRYTSFLYVAACAACARLARAVGDDEFGGKCTQGLERGKEGLQRLLWDEQGGAWLQAWCEAEDEHRGHALQGEAMYV
jgi:hypothetical protein